MRRRPHSAFLRVVAALPLVALLAVGCGHGTAPTSAAGTSAPVPSKPPAAPAPAPQERALGAFSVTCHTGSGRTASGRVDGPGLVSVDPAVIPLGTEVRVEKVGTLLAADHGGAVDGHSLDVWTASEAACTAFGRQHLQVWRIG